MDKLTNMIRLILIALIVGSEAASVGPTQYLTEEPSDVTATTGDKVRLNCQVDNRQGTCQWTRDGFGLGTEPDLLPFSRYSYDLSEGRCDLLIEPVLVEDEGSFQCQVGAVQGVPALKSRPALLRVQQEPGRPHILQAKLGDVMDAVAGELVELECQTQGGRPAADIVWRHGDGSRLEAEVRDIISTMEDRKLFKTTSVLKFVPEQDEEIYCEAVSEAFPIPRKSPEMKIRVKDSGRASLQFSPDVVKVGEDVDVSCAVSGPTRVLKYNWRIDDTSLPAETSAVLKLEKVQAENNKMKISCRAETEAGELVAEGRLRVAAGLTITHHPESLEVEEGQEVSLTCTAQGAEVLEYVWTRLEDNKLAGVGSRLSLVGGQETAGQYLCTVLSSHTAPLTSRPGRIAVRRRPGLRPGGAAVYGGLGTTSMLACQVENFHNSSSTGWRLQGNIIHSDGVKYKIINQQNASLLTTNLVIMDTQLTDFTTYQCFLESPEGSEEMDIELRNENNSYFIVSVIVNLTGAILVFFFILFLCWRRRVKRNSVQFMEKQKQILKTEDKSVIDKLLLKNENFKIDLDFNCDDLISESQELTLKKTKRLNRFYSAPNGSFCSDNTVISYVHD